MTKAKKKKAAPPSAAERVANHRARVEAAGGRQVAIMLSGDAVAKLDAWREQGETITEVINRLLIKSRPQR